MTRDERLFLTVFGTLGAIALVCATVSDIARDKTRSTDAYTQGYAAARDSCLSASMSADTIRHCIVRGAR